MSSSSGTSGPWKLHWYIFEVVRDEIILIDTPESLITVAGEAPPSRAAFDVRDYAVLRVNDSDQAEWAVVKGGACQARPIESDAERREVRDTGQRRDAARKAVDWKRRKDVSRPPTMTVVDAEGCGFVQVYGWTADRAETVVVSLNGSELGLSSSPAVFDLSQQLVNLSVAVHVYDTPRHEFDFCSDVRMNRHQTRRSRDLAGCRRHAVTRVLATRDPRAQSRSAPRDRDIEQRRIAKRCGADPERTSTRETDRRCRIDRGVGYRDIAFLPLSREQQARKYSQDGILTRRSSASGAR